MRGAARAALPRPVPRLSSSPPGGLPRPAAPPKDAPRERMPFQDPMSAAASDPHPTRAPATSTSSRGSTRMRLMMTKAGEEAEERGREEGEGRGAGLLWGPAASRRPRCAS